MSLLAWALAVTIVIAFIITLGLAVDAARVRFCTPERLLKEVSDEGSPEELQRLFHWEFDARLAAYGLPRQMWKKVQQERIRDAQKCLRAVRNNIACFQQMALVRWEESADQTGNDATEAKALSAEMVQRAARCRVLLKYVELRLAITTVCDLVLWRLAEPGISEICEAAGTRLVNEYEQLVGATLTFCRKHGEHYYEVLLFALDSIVLRPTEPSSGEAS